MFRYYCLLLILHYVDSNNYFCNLNCGRHVNTVCQREPCGTDPRCGKGGKSMRLNQNNRKVILDAHNKFRNKIALGEDTAGGNSKSSNMRALSYDNELEFVAQCWSNACPPISSAHDACRKTKRFANVGQNMFATTLYAVSNYNRSMYINNHLTAAVNAWYSEIKDVTAEIIDKFQGSAKPIGHFTQVVWAKTTHIGCGSTLANSGKKLFIYCNYGPAGNWGGLPVYKRGEPCSECGSLQCNKNYKGLCGKSTDIDHWTPPFTAYSARFSGSFALCGSIGMIFGFTPIALIQNHLLFI